jgi:ssDNA-binding Zn-finger/Zn-ribbon topoisomerase 1
MANHPRLPHISLSNTAYHRRVTGEGPTYQDRQRTYIDCPDCKKTLQLRSLRTHRRRLHGIDEEDETILADTPLHEATSATPYRASFPKGSRKLQMCPVPNCYGRFKRPAGMRKHFLTRHPLDSICIAEEGGQPLPKCPKCGLHISPHALNHRHLDSITCQRGAALQARREQARLLLEAKKVTITTDNHTIPQVPTFCYLGRVLASNNSDWPAIYKNLKKARVQWGLLSRPLIQTGVSPRYQGYFYKAVVQSVLLYGSESWTMTPQMLAVLRSFHHKIARRISGYLPQRNQDDTWHYPPITEALETAGLFPIEHYIRVRQNTIATYIATRPIL